LYPPTEVEVEPTLEEVEATLVVEVEATLAGEVEATLAGEVEATLGEVEATLAGEVEATLPEVETTPGKDTPLSTGAIVVGSTRRGTRDSTSVASSSS
jgi:hypothetical protein